jgi:hypothetical protein
MDRRNDWNLAARDKRIEMCGYQIDGGRIGSICYNGAAGKGIHCRSCGSFGP